MLERDADRTIPHPALAQEMRRFRRNGAEEPILTRHFGYDIQMRRAYDFLEATEAGNGASQA